MGVGRGGACQPPALDLLAGGGQGCSVLAGGSPRAKGPRWMELAGHAVHVWTAQLDVPAAVLDRYGATLSADERMRARRFRRADLRHRYVASRGVLRALLAAYLGTSARALRFAYGLHGKPALPVAVRPEGLEFNLSHSGAMLVVAIGRCRPLGIDVEQVRAQRDVLNLARRFFHPEEVTELALVPAARRAEAFHACWSRKEALVKGLGAGLTLPLRTFRVPADPPCPGRAMRPQGQPDAVTDWMVVDLGVAEGYTAALAVAAGQPSIRRLHWPTDLP